MLETNSNTEVEIRSILSKILEVSADELKVDTHFIEDLGADSMTALEIMSALEKKYKIEILEQDLPKLATLSQVLDLVNSLLNKGK